MQTPNEKGWIIRGACERVWFLPYTAVVQDYKNYLMVADGLTSEQADFQIDEGLDAIIEFLVIDCSMKACDESGIDKAPDAG